MYCSSVNPREAHAQELCNGVVGGVLLFHRGRYHLAALWMGALFGLVTYGTYDLTNAATLKGWSLTVTIVDMLWGAFLAGLSAAVGVWVALRFI